jgi:hypothetical protein
MKIQAVTLSEFNLLRSKEAVVDAMVYEITNSQGDVRFGWSDDGDFVYMYPSLRELVVEHWEFCQWD